MAIPKEHKDRVLNALNNMLGDDHIRARMAFKNYSPEQMKKEYGKSGKTCQEILNEYEAYAQRIQSTIDFVKTL